MKGKAQMSTSPHVNDVFDAFVAAKQAIDKVPDLEAQIAKLTADLQTANQMVEQYDIELAHHKEELSKAQDAKSTVEASLETHRKSNSDLQARFDLVLGTLRDITSGIGTTLGVVEPPKEPEPAPQVDPTASTALPSMEAASVQTGSDTTLPSEVSVPTDPTLNGSVSTAPVADIITQSVSVPTDPTQPDWKVAAGTSSIPTAESVPSGTMNTSASGQSELVAANENEARRRQMNLDWFDTSGFKHAPEVPVTPAVPFAPSIESQSPNAPSADATASSTTPVAPPSGDVSSPDFITGHNPHRDV